MNAISPRFFSNASLLLANNLVAHTLRLLWHRIRLPTFLLLSILEPVVSFVFGSLAILGVLTAFFWKFAGPRISRFFWSLAFLSASSSSSSLTASS